MPTGADETLHLSQAGAIVTVGRVRSGQGARDGATEYWNQRDLLAAIGSSFERGGRTVDRKPMRIVFDETFSPEQARRVMDSVSLHLTRARGDRLAVVYQIKPGLMAELARPITKASVGKIKVAAGQVANGIAGTRVMGSVAAEAGMAKFQIGFDALLVGARDVNTATVQRTVEGAVRRAVTRGAALEEIPPEIYHDLVDDLEAVRAGSYGTFHFADFGDLHLTLFEHGGAPIEAFALAAGRANDVR
jgi:hypothetical protein